MSVPPNNPKKLIRLLDLAPKISTREGFIDEYFERLPEHKSNGDAFKTYAAPSFFPQPASDRFWIDDLANIAKLDLYNLSGKRVAEFSVESRNQSFEIQGLPNGIYFVKMLDGRSHVVGVQRLIKSALD